MLANERKRTARWLPEVPIYEIQVGNDEGQVPLLKLQSALSKLPRNLRGGEVTEIRKRLDALGNAANVHADPQGADADERPPGAPPALTRSARPHDHRADRPVVQATPVGVDDDRGDHQADQDRPQRHPPEAQSASVHPHDLDAEDPLAEGRPRSAR